MTNLFHRTEMLIGKNALEKLSKSRVAVFGIGGVGGYVVESLARSGIGIIDLIDNDNFSETNINRQIYATIKTIGQAKVEVAKKRVLEINPQIKVNTFQTFYNAETAELFDFSKYDYIVDAIDSVSGKIELIINAQKTGCPIISSMGTGNKINPTMLEVSDIYKTSVCPLARVMRTELKKRGVKKLKVVYSKETPIKPQNMDINEKKSIPGSVAFVPSVAGLILSSEVVKDLIIYDK